MLTRAVLCHGLSRLPDRSPEWGTGANLAAQPVPLEAEGFFLWQDEEDGFNEAISRILLGEQDARE